jgi:hypothetical protein
VKRKNLTPGKSVRKKEKAEGDKSVDNKTPYKSL